MLLILPEWNTACPRSVVHFHMASILVKMDSTSWSYCTAELIMHWMTWESEPPMLFKHVFCAIGLVKIIQITEGVSNFT